MGAARALNFHETHERLLAQLHDRLRNGEVTERSLARHLGISQPHVNNVLRGRRKLSPEIADLLLNFLHVSLLDLYADGELRNNLHSRLPNYSRGDVAGVLRIPIGCGRVWESATDGRSRYRSPVPAGSVPGCSIFARVDFDQTMAAMLRECNIAMLDTSVDARLADYPGGLFVVERRDGTSLRWLRSGARVLYLLHELSLNHPLDWELLPVTGNDRLEVVKGRVLWLGQESTLMRP